MCPPAAWAAAAQRAWDAGADGIYVFNLFAGPYSNWKESSGRGSAAAQREYARTVLSHIGAPASLKKVDALYAISDAGAHMPSHFWAKDAEEFSRALPLELPAGRATELPPLVVGRKREALRGVEFTELRVDVTGLPREGGLTIAFNGVELDPAPPPEPVARVMRYRRMLPRRRVRTGENQVLLTASGSGVQAVGVELWLRRDG
ncbi:MAG: hypothetical protein FJX77_15760 [Armatimonadetes bacterium]|nr:hypothetical protein [Armatimonadota bacterium]